MTHRVDCYDPPSRPSGHGDWAQVGPDLSLAAMGPGPHRPPQEPVAKNSDHLTHLLGGLDQVLTPTTSAPANDLAQALRQQGEAQGLALTEREAALAARLVLTQQSPALVPASPRLSADQVKAYFRLPALAPTPEEKAAQRASRYAPRRWGRELGCSAVGLAMVAGALGATLGMRWLSQFHLEGLWVYPLYIGATGAIVMGLIWGTLKTILGLVEAVIGRDTAAYDARQLAAYEASLDRLSDAQLSQVGEAMQMANLRARANRTFDYVATEDQIRAALKRRGLT